MAAAGQRLSKTKVWVLPADVCIKVKSTIEIAAKQRISTESTLDMNCSL